MTLTRNCPEVLNAIDLLLAAARQAELTRASIDPRIGVQQLLDPACRLLTLLGPSGMGKTRLVIKVATRPIKNATE